MTEKREYVSFSRKYKSLETNLCKLPLSFHWFQESVKVYTNLCKLRLSFHWAQLEIWLLFFPLIMEKKRKHVS